eukprot:TRINITY_DN1610_c0_g1_i1.p1 TRINITY_DN1610_c0_g1~~TRINITY_DN1610_c0_g1_i1.p1  ORF type:complete len:488 (+),score=92.44 TRINITY_DN1610_c0_g1_i1:61-1524(+)
MARMPKLLSLLFTFALSGVRAGATCQDDPEIELCDYKSPTGECSGDDLDLCDYKMTPSPSPSDTCSGDDLDLCDYKMTPSPSPPGAGDPSMCPPPSPPPSLSGTCSGDDLDLCDYKMSESPNSSGMCSGDDLDLCDYKQSRSMTCKDDVEVDLCDYITDPLRGKTCKNDPDVDLCDYKVGHLLTQVPVPSSPSLPSPSPLPPPPRQPCTPTPTPTESPSPTPEPVLAPTPEPAPSPTPESPAPTPAPEDTTKTTTVVYQVASYDAELELDDVTKFDQQKFIESLATSQATVDADEVEVESVQYVVKTSYDFPDTMDEAQVKLTIVNSQGVSADNVEVKKMEQRRLAGSRRLAAGWDVVIKTSDAAAVSAIVEKAKDKEAIKKAAEDQGIPDVTVAVKSEPKQAVEVKFKVKSEPNSADVIESIDTSKLGEELGTKLGVEVVAAVEFKGKAEEIVTPVEVEEEDADGAKALSSAVGICFVLGSIIMRM